LASSADSAVFYDFRLTFLSGALFLPHVIATAGRVSDKASEFLYVPDGGAGKLVGLLPLLQWTVAEPEM
jgi:hypothetical protein